jgi:molybdopterin-guanine dinucleotide biosynthesis protein A
MIALGILAGGHSRRWGGRPKAIADFFGVPMTLSLVRRLALLPFLGLCIRDDQQDWAKHLPIPLVIEKHPEFPEGPLKGIHCLLSTLPDHYEWLLVTPCDMPWIPPNIAQTLLWQAQRQHASIVTLAYANQRHSLVMLIHRSEEQPLANLLLSGTQRVSKWLSQRGAVCFPWPYSATHLSNLNHPEILS